MATAFAYVRVTVAPATGHRLITWRLHPAYVPPSATLKFYIELGESSGTWERINALPVVNDNIYVDNGARLRDPRQLLYYRVVLVDTNEGVDTEHASVPTGIYGELTRREWNLSKEILRRKYLDMIKNVGTFGYLLRKREWGTPCTCADPDLGTAASQSCPTCLGTGMSQGYYPACPYWLSFIKSGPITRQDTGVVGTKVSQDRQATGINYPTPATDDVWVDSQLGERYIIGGAVEPAIMLRNTPLVLAFALKKLATSDSIYQIPVDTSGADGWTKNIAVFNA
jgi:hypothetical protein